MRITIFGSYNNSSIGDKAILVSLLHLLFNNSPENLKVNVFEFQKGALEPELSKYKWNKNVTIFSLSQNSSTLEETNNNFFLKRIFKSLPKSLRTLIAMLLFQKSIKRFSVENSNALIIGGGNLLMDLYPAWPGRLFVLYRLFTTKRKPIYLIGVGAFPISQRINDYLLKKVAKGSKYVLVRDKDTLNYVQRKWGLQAEYIPDLALSYPLSKPYNSQSRKKNIVAVNVVPIYGKGWPYQDEEKYQRYIETISKQLFDYYLLNNKTRYVFYDTNYPMNRSASLAVIKELLKSHYPKEFISYEDRLHTSDEITKILMNCNYSITTKLHAAILALRTGIPVIALVYQPKVKSVLRALGIHEKAILELKELDNLSERMIMLDNGDERFKLDNKKLVRIQEKTNSFIRKILDDISESAINS